MINPDLTLLIQMGVVLILWFTLSRLFFRPLAKVIKERKDHVENSNRAEEDKRKAADDLNKKYESEINAAKEKAVALREDVKNEGLAKEKEILESVNNEYDKIVKEAKLNAKKEYEEAKGDIAAFAKDLSVIVAEKILQRKQGASPN